MSDETTLDLRQLGRLSDAEKVELAMRLRRARAELARTDYNQFASFVLRDEVTGKPLKQAWTHMDWARQRELHRNALFIAHVEAGKTQQFSVGTVLWALGRNPRLRIAVVSRAQFQASKIVRSVAQYIEQSPELRMVFPHLVPGRKPGDKWTETMLTVNREGIIKEPSLQAFGVDGAITGSRVDGFIIDDILDEKNTRTKALRDQVERKFFSQFWSRRSKYEPWVYFLGNAWHPDDLYTRLESMGWPCFRYPVIVTEELAERGITEMVPDLHGNEVAQPIPIGDPSWRDHWPEERIEEVRSKTPPLEFARAYLCVSRDDKDARFRREWIEKCTEAGRVCEIHTLAHTLGHALRDDPFLDLDEVEVDAMQVEAVFNPENTHYWEGVAAALGVRVYTGVDLSTGKGKDLTCLFTMLVYPDGDRRVLDIQSGRWQADEIFQRIVDVHRRFGSIVMVENVAAQDYIVQLLRKQTNIPVFPFTTGRNKADPRFGVESLAGEIASTKWIIPCGEYGELDPEVEAWIQEMLFYNPDGHTGDRLMAMWFAREASRRFDPEPADGNTVGVQILG